MSRSKISEYIEKEPTKCAIIGIGIVAVLGLVGYKIIQARGCKQDVCKTIQPKRPEEEIKTIGVTPGAPSDSEDEPLLLRQSIKPKRDPAGIIDKDTLVKIFNKRSTIKGMRKMDKAFKDKRRASFRDPVDYK